MINNHIEIFPKEAKRIEEINKAQKLLKNSVFSYEIVFSFSKKNKVKVYYICKELNIKKDITDKNRNKSLKEEKTKSYNIFDKSGGINYTVSHLNTGIKLEIFSKMESIISA